METHSGLSQRPHRFLDVRMSLPKLFRTGTFRDMVTTMPETAYQYPRAVYSFHRSKFLQSALWSSHLSSLWQLHNIVLNKKEGLSEILCVERMDSLAPASAQEKRMDPLSLPHSKNQECDHWLIFQGQSHKLRMDSRCAVFQLYLLTRYHTTDRPLCYKGKPPASDLLLPAGSSSSSNRCVPFRLEQAELPLPLIPNPNDFEGSRENYRLQR